MGDTGHNDDRTYRAYLRDLALSLLPPSISLLPSQLLALASSSLSLTLASPLEWAHPEKDIDFWDARRAMAQEWEKGRGERLEVGRETVEGMKEVRRKWVEGVKAVEGEEIGEGAKSFGSFPLLPFLSDEYLLPRTSLLATAPAPHPAVGGEAEAKSLLVSLAGPAPAKVFPKADERLKEMDAMGDVEQGLDLKLAATKEEIEYIKQARTTFRASGKQVLLEDLLGEEGDQSRRAEYPRAPSPRLGSPPLFPRQESLSSSPLPAQLPRMSEVEPTSVFSDVTSSPFGGGREGVGMERWNREENILAPALSSSTIEATLTDLREKPLDVWSSSAPSSLGVGSGGYELEKPLFPRPARNENDDKIIDLTSHPLLDDDDEEIDELDSDSEAEANERTADLAMLTSCLTGSREKANVQELLKSDETAGEAVSEKDRGMRLRIAHLPHPSTLLPSPPAIPLLSSFSSQTPAGSTSPNSWALVPVPTVGLSMSLSWTVWSGPHDEDGTMEEFVASTGYEREGGEGEAEAELRTGAEEVLRKMQEERIAGEKEAGGGMERWPGDEEREEAEEVEARVPLAVVPPDRKREGDDTERPQNSTPAALEDDVPPGDQAHLSPPLAAESAPLPSSGHPTSSLPIFSPIELSGAAPALGLAAAATASSSSDFGFIFPDPSPPSPPQKEAAPPPRPALAPVEHPQSPSALVAASVTPNGREGRPPSPEKANPSPASPASIDEASPSWSNSTALDRFLLARGRDPSKPPAAGDKTQEGPAKKLAPPAPRPRTPRSSPPPGSIPFTIPSFLAAASNDGFEGEKIAHLKITASSALLQMRPHFLALQQRGFQLIHRSTETTRPEPHLTVAPGTGVLFVKLVSLLGGGAVRLEEAEALLEGRATDVSLSAREEATKRPRRPEALFTTLLRLLRLSTGRGGVGRYDRLLVLLEEPSSPLIGGNKPYAYTPPVLVALQALASALADSRFEVGGRVEVALSKGEGHSAGLVGRWCEWLTSEDEERGDEERGGLPVVDVWGEREWVREDPTEDELSLLDLAGDSLDPLSVAAILGVSSLDDFLRMETRDREAVFGGLVGQERVTRLPSFHPSVPVSTLLPLGPPNAPFLSSGDNSTESLPAFIPLSQIGSSDGDGDCVAFEAFDFEKYEAEMDGGRRR